MTNVHVYPQNDQIGHELNEECACLPEVEPVEREDGSIGYVYVHHQWKKQLERPD